MPSMVVTSKSGADWPTRLPVWGGGGAGAFVGGTGVGVSVGGTAVGGAGVGGAEVGVSAGGAAGVVAGWAGVLAAAVGVASSVPLRLPMFCREAASSGVFVGVAGIGVAVGCACWTGGVVGSVVGSVTCVQAPMTAATRAVPTTSATCRRDTIFDDGPFIISPYSRFVTAAAYAVTASNAMRHAFSDLEPGVPRSVMIPFPSIRTLDGWRLMPKSLMTSA